MPYTAPAGNTVDFTITNNYTPQGGSAVAFVMSEEVVSSTVVSACLVQAYTLTEHSRTTILAQTWSVFGELAAMSLEQTWAVLGELSAMSLAQAWSLRMGADLIQPWADAPVIKGNLLQPYGNAGVLTAALLQRWRDTVPLTATLNQHYALTAPLINVLRQPYALTADPVKVLLSQGWNIADISQVVATLSQPYALAADGAIVPGPVDSTGDWLPGTIGPDGLPITDPPPAAGAVWRYGLDVLANGMPVRVSHCNIEGDLSQDVLTCEIHPETEAEYLRCPIGSSLSVTVTSQGAAESFSFVVTAPRIEEQHGDTRYIVEAMSPAVHRGEPYADPVVGELTGIASTLADTLAGSVSLDWQTVDWAIPSATWITSDETPIALLKTMAASVGAVVQSQPDGSVRIMPEYPNQWRTAATAGSLTEILDTFTSGSTPDQRPGYNRYLVGSQMSSADTLRLEELSLSAVLKEVRGYQVPWTGAFTLAHTGGAWVLIEPMGIEERQETETVEFVGGAGRVRYPLYAVDTLDWQEVNLGSITTAEDGSLQSSVAGESLLAITYTTRCLLWRVRDPQNEQLQLVAEI